MNAQFISAGNMSGSPTNHNKIIETNVGTSTKSAPRAGVSTSGFKRRNRKIVP